MNDVTRVLAGLTPEQRALLEAKLEQKRRSRSTPESASGSIGRRPSRDEYPVAVSQEQLWFLDRLEPNSAFYNIPTTLRLREAIDPPLLEGSFAAVVERHEVLRSSFVDNGGRPRLEVAGSPALPLPVVDLGGLEPAMRRRVARRLALEEARRPFNLSRPPLLRLTLLRLAPEDFVLLLNIHHIIADGWSLGVLVREVLSAYRAGQCGERPRLAELPIQFADFAWWQRRRLSGGLLDEQLAYWREQLADAPPVLDLPFDRPRASVQSFRGGLVPLRLTKALSARLDEVARRHDASLFMVLLAAFQIVLARYSGQQEVVVGAPVANRQHPEVQNLIGYFVNTVALRARLDGDPSFATFLEQTRETVLGAWSHQDLPFARVVEAVLPRRAMSYNPIYQVQLAFLAGAARPEADSEEGFAVRSGTARLDLALDLTASGGLVWGAADYNADLFDAATMIRLLAHYTALLGGIAAAAPEERLSELPWLADGERQQLLVEWNDTGRAFATAATADDLLERSAARVPERVAAIRGRSHLSYGELAGRAHRVGHFLRSQGIGAETGVGLCCERSLEALIGIFGVLAAGGYFVPLDPAYPLDRLAFMIDDSGVSWLLSQRSVLAALPLPEGRNVLSLDGDEARLEGHGRDRPRHLAGPNDLIYQIYTSGSTGRPKGVQLQHRGLLNFLAALNEKFTMDGDDRFLQFASLSFDAAVWEIFRTVREGAALVLAETAVDLLPGSALERLLQGERISVATLPPSVLAAITGEQFAALRVLITAGEACSAALIRRWAPGRRFLNGYGPTESTVCSSVARYRADSRQADIGRPIGNLRIHVTDRRLHPQPIGVHGELCIAGVGLARGYRGRAGLSAERFVPDPFAAVPGERLYRTGDRVRLLADGRIDFLGRLDHQVKLRGFRIELGEIENVLRERQGVRDVMALIRDEASEARLVAYLIAEDGHELVLGELRAALQKRLPAFAIPAAFVVLEAFPMTPNGKVDRRALPLPSGADLGLDASYVAPRNPLEETLVEIWQQVLGVERIGAHDDFFALGGDSLRATELLARTRQVCGVEMSLRDFFENPTVAHGAELVAASQQADLGGDAELDALLGEIEGLSEDELDAQLAGELTGDMEWGQG